METGLEERTQGNKERKKRYLESLEIEKVFSSAESIQIELNGKKYSGEIHSQKVGEYVVFKVDNVDDALTKFTIGYESVSFKLIDNGKMRSFPSRVTRKKLPLLLLKYPFKEAEQVEREYERRNLKIDTPVIILKRENEMVPPEDTGMGTIVNISEGGCGINTSLDIRKGDRVNFYLEVFSHVHKIDIDRGDETDASTGSEGKMLDLKGVVVNIRELTDGMASAGLKFYKLGGGIKNDIRGYMKRRIG